MRPSDPSKILLSPFAEKVNRVAPDKQANQSGGSVMEPASENGNEQTNFSCRNRRPFELVKESMHSAISMNKTEVLDDVLNDFTEGYFSLSGESRKALLLSLAKEYDLNRAQVREMIKQYLGLELPKADPAEEGNAVEESSLSAFYRIERNLRHALKPAYEVLFERLNTHPGGLKFLSILRADILSILA